MSERPGLGGIDWTLTTWKGHRRAQLERWASMSLDQILEAQEEMAERSRDLAGRAGDVVPRAAGRPLALQVAERGPTYGSSASSPHDLPLSGCTPEPLMAYLKALGILRLVSEQKDPDAHGWWKNDVFWLRSPKLFVDTTTDEGRRTAHDQLMRFFLADYRPTPIVAPWAGGSGFFTKDDKKAVRELGASKARRAAPYARAIEVVQAIIADEGVRDKPKDEQKVRLIRRYRRQLPDEVVNWMDAVMVLRQDTQTFAPLLGTGGNDGHLDFTQNFMQRIVSLGLHRDDCTHEHSGACLANALFAIPTTLGRASVGQFAPGRAGGPNATQGFEGGPTDNPWDFILMIEGAVLFAGAVVRRFGVDDASRTAFPFTVRAVAAGFDSPAAGDEAASRGELWLPLWTRPATTGGLRQLLSEGRAEVSGRRARTGTDFARAVAGLGVDRGIAQFTRVGFLKRSGKAFLAAPLGRFDVVERSGTDLLREADPWVDRLRSACSGKEAPPRVGSALRRVDAAIFAFCRHGGARFFQEILVTLGATERALAGAERFRDKKKLRPLAHLSADWINAADDGTIEFGLAAALASVYDADKKICPLRGNLEPVDWLKNCRGWAEKDRAVVWNAADLPANLASVLERRLMDGARAGCPDLPVASSVRASLDTVAAFLAGEIDDRRIADLIWGLVLISDRGGLSRSPGVSDRWVLPRAYALLKLLFLPRPLAVETRADGVLRARLLRHDERGGVVIRPEPAVLHLVRGGRLGEACAIAMRRLRVSGLAPMLRPTRARGVRDGDWRELDHVGAPGMDPLRLAAALLIPISDDAVSGLMRLVVRGNETGAGQASFGAAMTFEGDTPS